MRLPREELLEVARRVSQLAQRNAPLRFAFSEGELKVAAETPDIGDAAESLPAPFSGEPLEIAFNPQYLIEGIESVRRRRDRRPDLLAAAPGPAAPGRHRGLLVPRDADPAERLGASPRCGSNRSRRSASATSAPRELELGEGVTLLHGPNGAGKTNLLEALYMALTGRSCRTRAERETIAFGEPLARAEAVVEDARRAPRVPLRGGSRGGPPASGERLRRPPADAASLRPALAVFMPDRLALVKGPPAARRSHLDGFVAALHPARAEARRRYARALAQRNALLGRIRAGARGARTRSTPGTRSWRRPGSS